MSRQNKIFSKILIQLTEKRKIFISKSVHVSLSREFSVRAHLEIKLRMYESVAISQLDNVFIRFWCSKYIVSETVKLLFKLCNGCSSN